LIGAAAQDGEAGMIQLPAPVATAPAVQAALLRKCRRLISLAPANRFDFSFVPTSPSLMSVVAKFQLMIR
jgi:hypothetical protein